MANLTRDGGVTHSLHEKISQVQIRGWYAFTSSLTCLSSSAGFADRNSAASKPVAIACASLVACATTLSSSDSDGTKSARRWAKFIAFRRVISCWFNGSPSLQTPNPMRGSLPRILGSNETLTSFGAERGRDTGTCPSTLKVIDWQTSVPCGISRGYGRRV